MDFDDLISNSSIDNETPPQSIQFKPIRKRKKFTQEEDDAILQGCKLYGRDWKTIQYYGGPALKDRTNEQIKDRFRTLVKQGKADPNLRPLATQRRRGGREPVVENDDEQDSDSSDEELVVALPREQGVAAAAERAVIEIDDSDTDDSNDQAESERDMLKPAPHKEKSPQHVQANTCVNKTKYACHPEEDSLIFTVDELFAQISDPSVVTVRDFISALESGHYGARLDEASRYIVRRRLVYLAQEKANDRKHENKKHGAVDSTMEVSASKKARLPVNRKLLFDSPYEDKADDTNAATAVMESSEKTESSQGIKLCCHGPFLEDESVMNAIMLEEESDTAATSSKRSEEVKTSKDVHTVKKENAAEEQNCSPDDGRVMLTSPRQDFATASCSKDTVSVRENESKTTDLESTWETRSPVELQTSLLNANDVQLARNLNRFEAAIQAIKERSSVMRQMTLSNVNDAQFAENLNRFEATIKVIKECQDQIRELQNDTVRNREEISQEIMFWRNQEAEWKKQLPFYKECMASDNSTARQKTGN